MTDTTHLSYVAEDLIAHKLQRAGFLVTKPKFDQEGADLLVFLSIGDASKFCRIQCKGRTVINRNSNVEIPASYISNAFILLIFVEDGNKDTNLYCFFNEDIEHFFKLKEYKNVAKNKYRITIPKNISTNKKFTPFLFDTTKIKLIKNRIKNINTDEEMRKIFSLVQLQSQILDYTKKINDLDKYITELNNIEEQEKILNDKIKILTELKSLIMANQS